MERPIKEKTADEKYQERVEKEYRMFRAAETAMDHQFFLMQIGKWDDFTKWCKDRMIKIRMIDRSDFNVVAAATMHIALSMYIAEKKLTKKRDRWAFKWQDITDRDYQASKQEREKKIVAKQKIETEGSKDGVESGEQPSD